MIPGDYDENSFWYHFLSPEQRALDQAIKARRAAERAHIAASNVPLAMAASSDAKVADLEQKLFSLALYTRTILQLLVDKGLLSTEEFAAKLDELDHLDGIRDGR